MFDKSSQKYNSELWIKPYSSLFLYDEIQYSKASAFCPKFYCQHAAHNLSLLVRSKTVGHQVNCGRNLIAVFVWLSVVFANGRVVKRYR